MPRDQTAQGRAGDLGKSRGMARAGDRFDPVQGFEFLKANQAVHGVVAMYRVLGVSPSGYYAWLNRSFLRSRYIFEPQCSNSAARAIDVEKDTLATPRPLQRLVGLAYGG